MTSWTPWTGGRGWKAAAAIGVSTTLLASGLVGGAAATTQAATATTASGSPPDACPEPFPVDELTEGMVGTGLTVERGTTPDELTATVVGVLDDGIALGLDLILVEVDSPALRRAGGVWSGMSGSPVYAPDGRLIGAVAYGLTDAASMIAGLTPAADMRELLARPVSGSGSASTSESTSESALEPAESVDLPAPMERAVVATGAATPAEAAAGMQRLPVPVGVSGASAARLDELADQIESRIPGARVQTAGAAPIDVPGSTDDIAPGSNFVAALSYGDVTIGSIGTTTMVCPVGSHQLAVAFGHPLFFEGAVSDTVHPARALLVQPHQGLGVPFKVANPGGVVGTLDQDRRVGVRGVLGPTPLAADVRVTATSADDGTTRSASSRVNDQGILRGVVTTSVAASVERALDEVGGGTSRVHWVFTGTRASGEPFTVDVTDMYADQFDVAFLSRTELNDQLARIWDNPYEQVTVDSVDVTVSVSTTYAPYRFTEVQVRQPDGSFVPVPEGAPLPAVAGSELVLRVVLRHYRDLGPVRNVDLTLDVPADAAGQSGSIDVSGGRGNWWPPHPGSFDELIDGFNDLRPNHSVLASLHVGDQVVPVDTAQELVDSTVGGSRPIDVEIVPPPS